MNKGHHSAPGAPGRFSAWTTGAKTGVGRALKAGSPLSFTLGKGVLNEVYFPREDIACIRACGCVVTDGNGFLSHETVDAEHEGQMLEAGVPAYRLTNEHKGKYRIHKEILVDPQRDAVLQRVRFERLPDGDPLSLYVYLTPHLNNHEQQNEAWVEDYKGILMLFAQSDELALAMACTGGWLETSVGFIGTSDGMTELRKQGRLSGFGYAGPGNVQLCARPATGEDASEFVMAIGFGRTPEIAAHQARSSLLNGFDAAAAQYTEEWRRWQAVLHGKWKDRVISGKYIPESAAVLAISESKQFPGGIIASLSVPWGEARTPDKGLGYHLVWPRDLVESAWGFLALGSEDDALRILNYLFTVQEADGRWNQNMWLDGQANLRGVQLDQVALPILLLASCHRWGLIDKARWRRYRPGLEHAVEFILRHGPATEQDRWEQQSGLSPFTLAAEVAALRAAAGMLGDGRRSADCRQVAEEWNGRIEEWTFVRGTPKASRVGVEGYYIRINPLVKPVAEVKGESLRLAHRDEDTVIGDIVSPDALALVRFGLRRPDDPRILDTIAAIDAELRRELKGGSCWRRFTADAYGEDEAGNPFVKTGCGRSWPLLTGERAHYELAAGNVAEAERLFHAMQAFSHQGLLPEQVWDEEDIPQKDLYCGRYTGSAMPLTWAHAEYIKLAVSLKQGSVFDMPGT